LFYLFYFIFSAPRASFYMRASPFRRPLANQALKISAKSLNLESKCAAIPTPKLELQCNCRWKVSSRTPKRRYSSEIIR